MLDATRRGAPTCCGRVAAGNRERRVRRAGRRRESVQDRGNRCRPPRVRRRTRGLLREASSLQKQREPAARSHAQSYNRPMEIVFTVTMESDGGFVAACVQHDILAEGDTWDELRAAVLQAVTA